MCFVLTPLARLWSGGLLMRVERDLEGKEKDYCKTDTLNLYPSSSVSHLVLLFFPFPSLRNSNPLVNILNRLVGS